jgi:Mrp family chromosome partitioning ATPase
VYPTKAAGADKDASMNGTPERWAEGPSIVESIWRWRYAVLAAALIAGAAGFVLSSRQDPVYQTSATMFLTNPSTSGIFQQSRMNLGEYLPRETERLQSSRVLTAAAETLNTSPGAIADQLEAAGDIERGTLTVTVTDGLPERAAEVANGVAAAYQEDVRTYQFERVNSTVEELDRNAAQIQEQIDTLTEEAAALQPAEPAADAGPVPNQFASQIGVLTQRLVEVEMLAQQLLVDARIFGSGVEFAEDAVVPELPVSPRPRRTAIVSALLGALLASALAYWQAGRGQRIAARDEPARILEVPLLGVLPTYKPPQQVTLAQRTALEPRTSEAYRFVYSSLGATLREHGGRSVMVTSAGPGIGKTESALQLAVTAVRRGQRVLLIDADLRMRGLTNFLRAERAPGLLDLAAPQDGVEAKSLVRKYPLDQHRHIHVLTAGRTNEREEDHLNESWFGAAFEEIVQDYDLTIVDSPPLLAVADTSTIAGYTDAIVLVVREGSDLEQLERVRQRLRFVQQRLVGYVYLTPTALDDSDFDYGLVRSQAWKELDGPETPTKATAASGVWLRMLDTQPTGGKPSGRPRGDRTEQDAGGGATAREPQR